MTGVAGAAPRRAWSAPVEAVGPKPIGPDWAVPMMGLVFGLGHIALGVFLLIQERREAHLRLHRSVA